MTDVAERLRKARKQKGCSSLVVADTVGVNRSSIQMYEAGLRTPRDSVKIKLADFYGLTVQELFY